MSRYVKQLVSCQFHSGAALVEDYRSGDMVGPECGWITGTSNDDKDRKDISAAENLATVAGALNELSKQKNINRPRQISSGDKELRMGRNVIRQLADRIDLSTRIRKRAFALFKRCYENRCVQGRSQDAIVVTCIYLACRQEGALRTIKEIYASSTSASRKEIGRCFKQIVQTLPKSNRSKPIFSKHLVRRFGSNLKLEQGDLVQKRAIFIRERAKEVCDIQSRAIASIPSAAVYMDCAAETKPMHIICI